MCVLQQIKYAKMQKPSKKKKLVIAGPVVAPRRRLPKKPQIQNSTVISRDTRVNEKPTRSQPKPVTDKTRVDYILVYKKQHLDEKSLQKIQTFISNLEDSGFSTETVDSSTFEDILFVKIYAPLEILLHYAELFGIELTFQKMYSKISVPKPWKFMANELTQPNLYGNVFYRARESILGQRPKTITTAERGLIIYNVLSKNYYGSEKYEYGVEKLESLNILKTAYPLHDGPWQWTEEGPLNDRQLLTRYWSDFKCWYKQQPLDLIEKYFGSEVTWYFAWLGFFNRMLVPASIMGLFCFLGGIVAFRHYYKTRNDEICKSNIFLCPNCYYESCNFEPLRNFCFHSRIMYVLDNPLVFTFAAIMSIWATLFMELWRRREAMLQLRWNLRLVEEDCSMRPTFEEGCKHYRYSQVTGSMEPYVPKKILVYRYTVTSVIILLMMFLMGLGIFSVMVYTKAAGVILSQSYTVKHTIKLPASLVASASGSVVSVVFIVIFEAFYERVALWLTNLENPRTQVDFDNAYTYKAYALAFVNNYSIIFYVAFLKARLYTYPGDKAIFTTLGGIRSDYCDPSGCIVELGFQLVITLVGKRLASLAKQFVIPQLSILANLIRRKKNQRDIAIDVNLPWEQDYLLNPIRKYHMMKEFMEMVIQYGFVIFFVAAFPIAPVLVLLNNLLELRIDAFKLTRAYRRHVAFKVPNLGAWNGILQGITYIGIATNAYVIAFTSGFVQRNVYKETVSEDLKGYVKSLLSEFNVSEFSVKFNNEKHLSVCYYPGVRNPPGHPAKYELTGDFWYMMCVKFIVVVIFEHIVVLLTGVLAYIIPDIPFSVKEHINFQKDQIKEIELKTLRETYLKKQKRKKSTIFQKI